MKKITLFTAFALASIIGWSQCPTEDIYFTTQVEIDNFTTNYPNCTMLTTDLTVDGIGSDVTNLDGFSAITNGQQIFIKSTQIVDLLGFSNLVSSGQFSLWDNDDLQNLTGLSSLETAGGLEIWINAGITSLDGLDAIQTIGTLNLFENPLLNDITNLNVIQSLESSIIGGNALTSLAGLENVETVLGDMTISNEPIINLDALSNLQSISGALHLGSNSNLVDISGLANISSLINLHLTENEQLTDLSGLENVQSISGRLRIGDNEALTDLSVFNNLTLLGYLDIYDNQNLTSLNGLENLLQIAHRLLVINNPLLSDIESISNISATQIDEVVVLGNPSLSVCDNLFMCDVVNNTGVLKTIADNAIGCNSTQEIQEMCLLSVEDVALSQNISIYPNPVSNVLSITTRGSLLFEGATVYSILGQKLLETSHKEIEFSHLSDGVYLVHLQTNRGVLTKQIVKQ